MAIQNRRVGDELRTRREELDYSLHKVEVATKIRGRYLRAIEASDFANLPNDVYSRGFVKQYALFLGLPAAEYIKRYLQERAGEVTPIKQVKPRALDFRLGATSRWVASLAALAVLAVIVGYLLWQFSSLTAAPKLSLSSPAKDEVIDASSIEVAGVTASGADVFLNDVPLPSDVDGKFKTVLILQPGINEVRVVSKNKLGKETRLARNILSKQGSAEALPGAVFDGVAVLLKAVDSTDVKLLADGKIMYEGTMAKGAVRLVSAKDIVQVTSSNPGALKATFTNSVVASYDFGVLGGDAGRTVEFTKTTSIAK
jgi:hypothetical protein